MSQQARLIHRLDDVPPEEWNTLTQRRFPFLRHEFLNALEKNQCLGDRTGWFPCHLGVFDDDNLLSAATPLYLKLNSFGEFVFDWAWADAYRQAGIAYYPKLVAAAPFTPATAPKVLVGDERSDNPTVQHVVDATIDAAQSLRVSSVHWLFTPSSELSSSHELLTRMGYQFHWTNRGYEDFDHFIEQFKSRKRKHVRKERRQVDDAGIELERIRGNEVSASLWNDFHELYRLTFEKYGNFPALTLDFFKDIARSMGEQILLVVARKAHRVIAVAYFLIGENALYGRYWGCRDEFPALHFEVCYYQGIEYCIENGIERFEPGAQGEHKISRGFNVTPTWSSHWIAEPRFRSAIRAFLARETGRIRAYVKELEGHSPFRENSA